MSIWTGLIVALAAFFILSRLKGGKRMSPTALKEKISAGAQILDVRSPGEYSSGAYPGARNIPLQDLGRRLGELQRDKAVVVYCASGGRSAAAASLLSQAGFTDVVNAGGLMHMPR
jgi:rhodanese-related sulfurtransferase